MDRRVGLLIGGGIFLAIILWLFFSIRGLLNQGKEVYLYNPLEIKLNVDIGKEHYVLSPNQMKKIEISEGEHSVRSKLTNDVIWDTTINITSEFFKKGGLINLSGEPLYEWSEFYGDMLFEQAYDFGDDSTSSLKSPVQQSMEQSAEFFKLDSTWMYGVIKEYKRNELVLEKTWDYNIKEDFEDEIPTDSYATFVATASKLFSKEGMLKYWYENYPPIEIPEEMIE